MTLSLPVRLRLLLSRYFGGSFGCVSVTRVCSHTLTAAFDRGTSIAGTCGPKRSRLRVGMILIMMRQQEPEIPRMRLSRASSSQSPARPRPKAEGRGVHRWQLARPSAAQAASEAGTGTCQCFAAAMRLYRDLTKKDHGACAHRRSVGVDYECHYEVLKITVLSDSHGDSRLTQPTKRQ